MLRMKVSILVFAAIIFGFSAGWFTLETIIKNAGPKRTIALYVENPIIPFESHIGSMFKTLKNPKPGDRVYGWFTYQVTEYDMDQYNAIKQNGDSNAPDNEYRTCRAEDRD